MMPATNSTPGPSIGLRSNPLLSQQPIGSQNGSVVDQAKKNVHRWLLQYNTLVDRTTPYAVYRWIAFVVLMSLFVIRVLYTHSWYIVCYALGIYQLNLFLAFLTPKFDPAAGNDLSNDADSKDSGPSLPTRQTDEFRPFIRRLPEFKFWYSCTRGTVIALFCTMFQMFNIPVFWPILVVYFFTLLFLTLRRQIRHMVKYKYVPFDIGKKSSK